MRLLAVVSKLTGVSTNVEASEVTLSSPSIVKLSVSREEVSQLTRVNQDLVVTLRSGETITIKNFYLGKGEAQNQLVLEDSNGALWWVQDTDGAFHFQHLDDLTPLMTAEGSHEGGAVWPWVLGGIAVAGGIGLAAGGGGGGGGGSDNNAGNGNTGTAMVAAAMATAATAKVTVTVMATVTVTVMAAHRQRQLLTSQTSPLSPA